MASEKMEYTITQEKVIDILMHAANRQDFAEFKRDMNQDMAEFKQEIKSDIAEFKQEIKSDIAQFKSDVKADINKLDGRIDKLDGRIDKLDGKFNVMIFFQCSTLLMVLGIVLAPYLKNIFPS